jgi:hypothetical protein
MAAAIRLNYCAQWPHRIDIGMSATPLFLAVNRIPGARPAAARLGNPPVRVRLL